MELLDFARGPALTVALAIFVLGTLWRLAGVLLLPRLRDLRRPARARRRPCWEGCAPCCGACGRARSSRRPRSS